MLYKTEFQIHVDEIAMDKSIDRRIEYFKRQNGCNLGGMIAEKIGFEKLDFSEKHRWELSVQVFSRKKWEVFYENLMNAIDNMSDIGPSDKNCKEIKLLINQLDEI